MGIFDTTLVPASEGLKYKHKYVWNVKACNPNNLWVFILTASSVGPIRRIPPTVASAVSSAPILKATPLPLPNRR